MQKLFSVVCCTPLYGENWKWFVPELAEDQIQWYFFDDRPIMLPEKWIHRPNLPMIRSCLQAILFCKQKEPSLLITHDSRVAFWCAFFAKKLSVKTKIIAYSFNFAVMPQGTKRRLMTEAFQQIDKFFVFSKLEKPLYSKYFNIPAERIESVLWCMPVPEIEPEKPIVAGDYICAIGGNARDYKTLMEAMEKFPHIPLVVVVRPENLKNLKVPSNVKVFVNIPQPQAMNILKYSRFMVLPLIGSEIPCGHVTLVAAMRFSKAFIITNSEGVHDYVINDYNCVTCEAFSSQALANEIDKLWNNSQRCQELGENGRDFAQKYCSEESGVRYMRHALQDILS